MCSSDLAFAGTTDTGFGKPSATLSLAGLDLATADGQQRLATRVDQAARAVCGESLATIHPDLEARARACRAGSRRDPASVADPARARHPDRARRAIARTRRASARCDQPDRPRGARRAVSATRPCEVAVGPDRGGGARSEEHTSEL